MIVRLRSSLHFEDTLANISDMKSGLFNRVRAACKTVAKRASHIQIDEDRISLYAASLPVAQIVSPELHPERHYLGHGDDTLAYFLTLDAVNFGSGYFPHLRKRPGMSGYFTIASSLTDYYRAHGPLSAQALVRLTVEDCAGIFGQDLEADPVCELMRLFTTALNDLGRCLLDRFDGRFAGLVEAADGSAERLVQLLVEMPLFDDAERYGGLEVPFYKRAQITAADLCLAFDGEGYGRFDDLDRLTMFADNLVPHVLRVDGMLIYEGDLLDRINAEELIPLGSPEEIEIRACAVHTVELLVEAFRKSGYRVTAMQLDHLLWNRGQQPHYKARPRHRTRCTFY